MTQPAAPVGSGTPPRPRSHRALLILVAALVAALLVAVAIIVVLVIDSSDDDGSENDDNDGAVPTSTPTAGPSRAAAGSSVDLGAEPGELPATLDATAASLRQFWSTEFEEVYGQPFQDLAGGLQPKTPDSPPWTCGGQQVTYADIKGNAFYCGGPDDDYIAYDAAFLLPQLNKTFGALTPSVVLAHEMGHAIQARAQVEAPSVITELQADCFAGAWVAYAESSDSDPVSIEESALDSSIRAIPALRDQPGTAATNPQAHGLAFDRVHAYQTGYEEGVPRCATFPTGEVVVTELPFRTVTEALTQGNLDYAAAVPFFTRFLTAFWSASLDDVSAGATYDPPVLDPEAAPPLPACPGDTGYDGQAVTAYCSPSNTVSWATTALERLHTQIGDMATAAALSDSWARSAQAQAGLPTSGTQAELQRVCFTGAWVAAIAADQTSPNRLSPGDIDEALIAVLTPLARDEVDLVESTSFERADALRAGVLHGLAACQQ
jgi:predicted metalloprotease